MIDFIKGNRALFFTLLITLVLLAMVVQGLEPKVWISILLSGVTLAALYFLIASGLSLIFGLMDVLNFAHGAIFSFGAYVGLSTFANPRLLFNTFPFFLALIAGSLLSAHFGVAIWERVKSKNGQQILWFVLLALSIGILLFALRQFPLRRINAFSVTAVGGAIATSEAQEPLGLMIQRVALLFVGGLPLGLLFAPRQQRDIRSRRPLLHTLVMAIGIFGLGCLILFFRDGGEQLVLGLSAGLRLLLAMIVGTLAGAIVGVGIETVLIQPFYGKPVTQLVLTLGLNYASIDMIEEIWGNEGHPPLQPLPAAFAGSCRSESLFSWFTEKCTSIDVLGRAFPTYRLFIIAIGIFVFIAVGLLLKRSRIGMIIRAGVQDSEMVQALGINVRRVFTFVFALGSGMAALGGVIAAPFLGVYPGMGPAFLFQGFIAVVIGGMGSYAGAAVGTLLLGLARAFGDHFVAAGITLPFLEATIRGSPAIAKASAVLIMAVVLLVRPAGIFGKKE